MTVRMDVDIETFRSTGFLIVQDVVQSKLIDDLYASLVRIFGKHRPGRCVSADAPPWVDTVFSEELLRLRNEQPDQFGAMYDTVQSSVALQTLMCQPELVEIAEMILGDEHGLSSTGHLLRMDPPGDQRNRLHWHQESAYYHQNACGDHGLVCWLPMHDMTPEHGPVEFCPGSHRLGPIERRNVDKANYGTSEQHIIPTDFISRFEVVPAVVNVGDAVFFHMDLFHRSGENVSSQIRFCGAVRFHRMLADDFVPGRLIYKTKEDARRAVAVATR